MIKYNFTAGTIRNKEVKDELIEKLEQAISDCYGPDAEGVIYSGGQTATRRTGTIRHDNGMAADVHVYLNGKQIKGVELAILAQYWASTNWGGVGLEMVGGGIHLDLHSPAPKGGGMFWFYSNRTLSPRVRKTQREMVMKGILGKKPPLPEKPKQKSFKWRGILPNMEKYRNGK